ncbi:MAG: protein kinase, partial [Dokdonella sp.]
AMLGVGGFGVVYRAHDLTLGIDVALKVLRAEIARRPEAFERFRDELLLARQVSSSHVVRIHDIVEHDGRWFISMDYVDGESLEHRLDRDGKLPIDVAISTARGLLEGLAAAHQRGVVHRDMKPANILLDSSGHPFITDFGIARSLGATAVTRTGMIVGTPEYLSPEQARGDPVDARSDLYAVGLILYEMLTGALPFSGGTPAETVMQRIVRPAPSLAKAVPTLPQWLYAFTDRLLQTDPHYRFASAKDALRALDARSVPRRPINRQRAVSVLLSIIVVGGAVIWLWQHPDWRERLVQMTSATTPRVAVLPIRTASDDVELSAIARALDEQLQVWMRNDPAAASIPRRRVVDALARQTPGMSDDALIRQLPDIANAAGANRLLFGELRRAGGNLRLELSVWPRDSTANAVLVDIEAADVSGLLAQYEPAMGTVFDALSMQATAAPILTAQSLVDLGSGLLALDKTASEPKNSTIAVKALSAAAEQTRGSPIIDVNLLAAQELAEQDLPAQATRDRLLALSTTDSGPLLRDARGKAQLDDGESEAAVKSLDLATNAYPHDVTLQLLLADALVAAGEGDKALVVLRKVVAADDQDATAWFALGRTAIQQGQADAAVSNYLIHALVLNRLRGDRAAEAQTSNALGVGYERIGQLEAASRQYAQAAEIRQALGDDAGLAKSLRNLAIVQAVLGDTVNADQTLDRVRKLLEQRNDRQSLAGLYNDRGVVAEERGDYAEALGFFRQALALRQQLNLPALVAESLNNVGFSQFNLGDFDNALAYWQQALTQFQQIGDRSGELHVSESLGLLDIARGRFDAARERLTTALQSAEDHQLPEEAAVAHTYLGQLALNEGRLDDAQLAARKAAEVFSHRGDQRGQAEAKLLQAAIALALGQAAEAVQIIGSLQPDHLSGDQRIAFYLDKAQAARLDNDAAIVKQHIAAAVTASADSQSALAIRVNLERVREALSDNDIAQAASLLTPVRADATRLGEIPLRLDWLELEIATALRGDHAAEAIERYREALAILRSTGRWIGSVLLHRLGALALLDRPAEAQAARDAADAQQAQLLADAPADARNSLRGLLDAQLRNLGFGNDH